MAPLGRRVPAGGAVVYFSYQINGDHVAISRAAFLGRPRKVFLYGPVGWQCGQILFGSDVEWVCQGFEPFFRFGHFAVFAILEACPIIVYQTVQVSFFFLFGEGNMKNIEKSAFDKGVDVVIQTM